MMCTSVRMKAAVAAATPADAALYKGSQAQDENTFTPGALDWNTTYYWRIDEVNSANADSPWKGSGLELHDRRFPGGR